MIDQKIVDYIKISLTQGKTKEELYKELLERGQTIESIQENFNILVSEREKEDISKKTIRIIVTIGAILVGAGIFSFIAANWQEISKTAKISIILISMLASYGAGWYLKEKLNLEKTGSALFLLGSIIYGAGIFLVAQMFHIRANWADGFILWMFGIIAIAFALESFSHFYFAIILGFVASIIHPLIIFFAIFGSQPLSSTSSISSVLLLIATITTFTTALIIRKKIQLEPNKNY